MKRKKINISPCGWRSVLNVILENHSCFEFILKKQYHRGWAQLDLLIAIIILPSEVILINKVSEYQESYCHKLKLLNLKYPKLFSSWTVLVLHKKERNIQNNKKELLHKLVNAENEIYISKISKIGEKFLPIVSKKKRLDDGTISYYQRENSFGNHKMFLLYQYFKTFLLFYGTHSVHFVMII